MGDLQIALATVKSILPIASLSLNRQGLKKDPFGMGLSSKQVKKANIPQQ